MKKNDKKSKGNQTNTSKKVKLPTLSPNTNKNNEKQTDSLKRPVSDVDKEIITKNESNKVKLQDKMNINLSNNKKDNGNKSKEIETKNKTDRKITKNDEISKKDNNIKLSKEEISNIPEIQDMPETSKNPRLTKVRIREINQKRNKRLEKEAKEVDLQTNMLYELKEYIDEDKDIKTKSEEINGITSPIEISHKKAQKILEEGGMIDAYKHLISDLFKNGMPEGNLYEYSSNIIKNYEKEWKRKKYKEMNSKIEKYFDNKKKLFLSLSNYNENLYYQVLQKREGDRFIKKLNKSRSSLYFVKNNAVKNDDVVKTDDIYSKIYNKDEINNNSDNNFIQDNKIEKLGKSQKITGKKIHAKIKSDKKNDLAKKNNDGNSNDNKLKNEKNKPKYEIQIKKESDINYQMNKK